MLTTLNKVNLEKKYVPDISSLAVFFYVTNNHQYEIDKLISSLQAQHLNFKRLKIKASREFFKSFPGFYKNANFIAWSSKPVSEKDFLILSQIFISKVIVIAFFYKGQIWSVSRVEKTSQNFLKTKNDLKRKNYTFNVLWMHSNLILL